MPERLLAPSVRAGRRFALLWLAVALLFQGFATQTHAHFGADRTFAATESARVAAVAVDGQKKAPVTPACPLCEEKALFGAYLASGSVTFAAPVAEPYAHAAATLPPLALRLQSHGWQSRAPPLFTT